MTTKHAITRDDLRALRHLGFRRCPRRDGELPLEWESERRGVSMRASANIRAEGMRFRLLFMIYTTDMLDLNAHITMCQKTITQACGTANHLLSAFFWPWATWEANK